MKVFDCFPFFNEFELLELRLETFYDIVDYFVIVEADKTHANISKPFNFYERRDEFKKYFPKIHYIMDTTVVPYKGAGDWSIENNQRNSIAKGLSAAEPDDLIMISDLDEFPNPAMLKTLIESFSNDNKFVDFIAFYDTTPYTKNQLVPFHSGMRINKFLDLSPVGCQQIFHSYYFDWVNRDLPWSGTVIGKFKHMESPQAFRNARKVLPRIVDGGWHFSSMGGVEKFWEKVRSAPDFQKVSNADKDFLEAAMKSGKYLIGGAKFVSCDVDEIKLPALKDFLKKYPHFIRG
ncbi:MAG: hypothetical protein IJK81_10830 [Selenomonadaceae bacterium]|nr:hypothetical protein [Selenomonadaceae bacterium]